MRTLAQIRAANALEAAGRPKMGTGKKEGDALSGYPVMIKTDGLIATLAYSVEQRKNKDTGRLEWKNEGECTIAQGLAKHLADLGITTALDPKALVEELAKAADAAQLRRATAEALAYLNYLKRFVA